MGGGIDCRDMALPPDLEALTLHSERLLLVPMTAPFIEAVLAQDHARAERELDLRLPPGWLAPEPGESPWSDPDHWLAVRVRQLHASPASLPWLSRAVLLPESREMIGNIGFHELPFAAGDASQGWPPDRNDMGGFDWRRTGNTVEIGYGISPGYRELGFATEAGARLIRWAHEDEGIDLVRATTDPANATSQRVLARLGFRFEGTVEHEQRGTEHLYELSFED